MRRAISFSIPAQKNKKLLINPTLLDGCCSGLVMLIDSGNESIIFNEKPLQFNPLRPIKQEIFLKLKLN